MKLIKIKKFKSEVSSFLYDLRNKPYVRKKSLDKYLPTKAKLWLNTLKALEIK